MSIRQNKIFNEYSRNAAITDIMNLDTEKPWLMTLKPYHHDRSGEQNALSHVWYAEVAAKLREDTAGGVKRFCKLHLGIPILRGDIDFREKYDRTLKGLSYEQKIEIMEWFPVTSLLKVEQMSLYLEQMQQHYADRIQLLFPGDPL